MTINKVKVYYDTSFQFVKFDGDVINRGSSSSNQVIIVTPISNTIEVSFQTADLVNVPFRGMTLDGTEEVEFPIGSGLTETWNVYRIELGSAVTNAAARKNAAELLMTPREVEIIDAKTIYKTGSQVSLSVNPAIIVDQEAVDVSVTDQIQADLVQLRVDVDSTDSDLGDITLLNTSDKSNVVNAINENEGRIDLNDAEVALNSAHRLGDGTDHSQVATNETNIATNTVDILTKANDSEVLKKDGSVELNGGYTPTTPQAISTKQYVDQKVVDVGAGDMAKIVYDTNDNGIVDNADYDGTGTNFLTSSATTQVAITNLDTEVKNNKDASELNTIHRTSSGTDHANVVLNDGHRTGNGEDHATVLANKNALTTKLDSVVGGTGITIDNTDPNNPIINGTSDLEPRVIDLEDKTQFQTSTVGVQNLYNPGGAGNVITAPTADLTPLNTFKGFYVEGIIKTLGTFYLIQPTEFDNVNNYVYYAAVQYDGGSSRFYLTLRSRYDSDFKTWWLPVGLGIGDEIKMAVARDETGSDSGYKTSLYCNGVSMPQRTFDVGNWDTLFVAGEFYGYLNILGTRVTGFEFEMKELRLSELDQTGNSAMLQSLTAGTTPLETVMPLASSPYAYDTIGLSEPLTTLPNKGTLGSTQDLDITGAITLQGGTPSSTNFSNEINYKGEPLDERFASNTTLDTTRQIKTYKSFADLPTPLTDADFSAVDFEANFLTILTAMGANSEMINDELISVSQFPNLNASIIAEIKSNVGDLYLSVKSNTSTAIYNSMILQNNNSNKVWEAIYDNSFRGIAPLLNSTEDIDDLNADNLFGVNIKAYGNNVTNRPATSENGWLENITHSDESLKPTYNTQTYTDRPNNDTWTRNMENGVWSAWRKVTKV